MCAPVLDFFSFFSSFVCHDSGRIACGDGRNWHMHHVKIDQGFSLAVWCHSLVVDIGDGSL